MAPRRSKNPKPTLGKTKVAKKPINKKVIKSHKKIATAKSFPCACVEDCIFMSANTDLRFVLGRPEYNEEPTAAQCTCKVHYKCANRWAAAHHELPSFLPCGCEMTTRGADFWTVAVPGRRWAMMEKEKKQLEREKQEEVKKQKEQEDKKEQTDKKKEQEQLGAEFDCGSDLTDLED